jgi:hypothetical protein
LQVNTGEVVVRVGIKLALKLREGLNFDRIASSIRIAFIAGQTVNTRILRLQSAQHVVEGAVFHHEDDNVLEII